MVCQVVEKLRGRVEQVEQLGHEGHGVVDEEDADDGDCEEDAAASGLDFGGTPLN